MTDEIRCDYRCVPHKQMYFRETVDGKRTWKKATGYYWCKVHKIISENKYYL